MKTISFNIFQSYDAESDLPENYNNEEQSSPKSQKMTKEFRPRTPSSIKIANGNRGAIILRLKKELESELIMKNPSIQINNITNTSDINTDLNNIDEDIREILFSKNIYFFKDIPEQIIIAYGRLLSNLNSDGESVSRISNNDDELISENFTLKSQKILIK